MKTAPVQLLRYVVESIHLDLNPEYRGDVPSREDENEQEDRFGLSMSAAPYTGGNDPVWIRLAVAMNEDAETWDYYRFRVEIAGEFQLIDPEPKVPAEEVAKFLLNSGFAALYGVARTLLLQMCATSPYPRLVLPMVNMQADVDALMARWADIDAADDAEADDTE